MSQITEEILLNAIMNDDAKSFKAVYGEYRLGRFPVLSLAYLYNARRILSAYEEQFIKLTDWKALDEPASISRAFSEKAGKCLRLYLNEVVTPLEMLLVLDKTRRLKRVYPLAKPSAAVKGRLKSVYYVKYALGVKFEGDRIILDRRPLSYGEKKKIFTACACSLLAVAVAVGAPVTATALIPERAEGDVTKLKDIDFGSRKEYTLKRDIQIPENFSVEKVNCKINGGGKKLYVGKNASLGELNGLLTDTEIISTGSPFFTTVGEKGKLENLTVNVTADVESDAPTSLVAVTNYGTIEGVTVNVGGTLGALAGGATEPYFGGIVQINAYKTRQSYGTVKNCTVSYSQFTLNGDTGVSASFGGIAGVNAGYLQDCTVSGKIHADTFDAAGVCGVNNGIMSGNKSAAEIEQISREEVWSPVVAGIVISNGGTVEGCENSARLSAVSDCGETENQPSVSVAGITCLNSGEVLKCKNGGAVFAEGKGVVYAGGIAARSCSIVAECVSAGDISVTADCAFVGGIMGCSETVNNIFMFYSGVAQSCISENKISVTAGGEDPSAVGGITGLIQQAGYIAGGETVYVSGGVTGCYFIGEAKFDGEYFGAVTGVCGENIYETNSYISGDAEYHYFEGNYYISGTAFGATVSENNDFSAVADKGATCATAEEIKNLEEYKKILDNLLKF